MFGSDLNYLDFFLLAVLGILTIRGAVRGFVAEVAGLISVVGGVILAGHFYRDLAVRLNGLLGNSEWVYAIAYVLILACFILLVGILARILGKVASFGFIQPVNQVLGGAAGFLKGFAICALAGYVLTLFVPTSDLITKSKIWPQVQKDMALVGTELPRSGFWNKVKDMKQKLPQLPQGAKDAGKA